MHQSPESSGSSLLATFERINKASSERISQEEQLILATDPEISVRQCLTSNLSVSPAILEILSKDDAIEVRRNVALNLNTPPEVLSRLLSDSDKFVREYAVSNPSNSTPVKRSHLAKRLAEEILSAMEIYPDDLLDEALQYVRSAQAEKLSEKKDSTHKL